ncbi:hypothetical protein OEZ85_009076 [Tetradesmus obliquus]|uniref:Uncharacterized protein n=1 Tax=Tetradesmus obliquus TaxID=3088 RepID=A0ABY8TPH7_TETOB|nr:hypothetical protein OEZ85_009076 [Tetradesmus obliquus]
MRPLLLLALLSCLLAAQLAAATRDTFTTGRALLKKPLKKRVATPVNLTRQQFVQATWALQDVTCAGVYATAKDKNFNNTLALAVTRDFMDVLNAAGWPAAALSVRVVRQPCKDITYNNKTYASFRAGVRFNSTTDTQVRDDMWAAVGDPDTASPCTGGYNTTLYKNVAALFAKYSLKVSQNMEYAGPCLPKPKPIIKAIVVDTPIIGTSCDPAAVEALANGVRATITSGLPPAESALVFVKVVDCKPTATGRRLLASHVTVTLSITTSPLLTTAAQVDAASRALYAAVTGKPSSSLPAGASLDTVLQMLNTDLKGGSAADLLVKVQTAIVAANLTTVFDATLTNATQVAGTQQAITCPNKPEFTGASFSTQCLGQIPGFDCIGSCINGSTVTASCSTAGTWTIPATASCPAEQQPVKQCTGVPSTTPEGGAWPTAGCAGLAPCDATCSGDATGSPFAVCDTVTGAWSAISGSCTPIRCLDSPLFGIAYANWATNCGTTVGSTCTATCASAAGSSIATLDAASAKAICCDAIYPADATCATSWTAGCPAGSTPNPLGLINGLVVGSTAAQSICCSGGAPEVSPSPPPCVPTCPNPVVGLTEACGTKSDGEGSYYGAVAATEGYGGSQLGNSNPDFQVPTQFPKSGKLVTQLAIHLDPTDPVSTTNDQRLHYTVSSNEAGTPAAFKREYIFSFGWFGSTDSYKGVSGPAFWVSASHNTGWPKNPGRHPVPIKEQGWYYLQHVFLADTCTTDTSKQCLYAEMRIFSASKGGACGALYQGASGDDAYWKLGGESDDVVDLLGGLRSFTIIQGSPKWQRAIAVDAVSYRSF